MSSADETRGTVPPSDHDREDALSLLEVYLNDHFAAARGGVDLIERCIGNNRGTELAARLAPIRDEITEDREELGHLIERLGFEEQTYKQIGASVAEILGRLKPNRELTGYSDLSRVLELEGLCAGVRAKLALWRSLQEVEETHPEIAATDTEELVERGERQLERLESYRIEAARVAFGPGSDGEPG